MKGLLRSRLFDGGWSWMRWMIEEGLERRGRKCERVLWAEVVVVGVLRVVVVVLRRGRRTGSSLGWSRRVFWRATSLKTSVDKYVGHGWGMI